MENNGLLLYKKPIDELGHAIQGKPLTGTVLAIVAPNMSRLYKPQVSV